MSSFDGWNNELYHHGVKGQKWGIRRYQNPDGSLTPEGERRYGPSDMPSSRSALGMQRDINNLDQKWAKAHYKSDYYAKKAAKQIARQVKKEVKVGITEHHPSERAMKTMSKGQKWANRAKDIESMQWRILGKAAQSGYSAKVTPVTRRVMRGRDHVMNALSMSSMSVQLKYLGFGASPIFRGAKVQGNYYSIKKPKTK